MCVCVLKGEKAKYEACVTIEFEALEQIQRLAAFCNSSTHLTTRRPNDFRGNNAVFGITSFHVLVVDFFPFSFSFFQSHHSGPTVRGEHNQSWFKHVLQSGVSQSL